MIHGRGRITCVGWDFMAQYSNSKKYICTIGCEILHKKTQQVYHVEKSTHMCKVGGVVESFPGDPTKSLGFSSKAKRPGSG